MLQKHPDDAVFFDRLQFRRDFAVPKAGQHGELLHANSDEKIKIVLVLLVTSNFKFKLGFLQVQLFS